eukprot:767083-Hanusia_phi.AAC.1
MICETNEGKSESESESGREGEGEGVGVEVGAESKRGRRRGRGRGRGRGRETGPGRERKRGRASLSPESTAVRVTYPSSVPQATSSPSVDLPHASERRSLYTARSRCHGEDLDSVEDGVVFAPAIGHVLLPPPLAVSARAVPQPDRPLRRASESGPSSYTFPNILKLCLGVKKYPLSLRTPKSWAGNTMY